MQKHLEMLVANSTVKKDGEKYYRTGEINNDIVFAILKEVP